MLFALGVDEETIMQDYLLTETLLDDFRQKFFNEQKDKLTNDALSGYKEIFAAKRAYLQAALDEIKRKYQTVETWLAEEYQLNPQNRQLIQHYYLD